MIVTTLPGLIPYVDNGLWPMLERFDFNDDVLACFPGPYASHASKPADSRSPQRSGGRHDDIFDLLRDMMKRNYNVCVVRDRCQTRLAFQGVEGTDFQFVLRKASAAQGGFSSSKLGPVIEQVSLLHVDPYAFELYPGHPNSKGVLIAHDLSTARPNHVDVWLAYEWRARAKTDFIECERSAFLGSVPFFQTPPNAPGRTTGIDPDLA